MIVASSLELKCQGISIFQTFVSADSISKFIRSENLNLHRSSHSITSNGFNFLTLEPVQGDSNTDSSDYFVSHFDSSNRLVKICHYETSRSLNNFEVDVFPCGDFLILALKDFAEDFTHQNPYGYLPGYFVYLKKERKIYFINTCVADGFDYFFEETFPTFSFKNISSISKIDDEFYLTDVFKLVNCSLTHFTQIIFEPKSKAVRYEKLFFYQSPMPEQVPVNEKTTFLDLENIVIKYKDTDQFIITNPCVDKFLPAWTSHGSHEYFCEH